jgi:hypothetical protein
VPPFGTRATAPPPTEPARQLVIFDDLDVEPVERSGAFEHAAREVTPSNGDARLAGAVRSREEARALISRIVQSSPRFKQSSLPPEEARALISRIVQSSPRFKQSSLPPE